MTDDEIVSYYVKKRISGHSTRELLEYMNGQELSKTQRDLIIDELDKLDKIIGTQTQKRHNKTKIIMGFCFIIIGVLVFLFGRWLYNESAQIGRIYVFNFVVWGVGIVLVFKGILNVIVGFIKS
ncbi:MAG: hypothetical protein J6T12_07110 [Salinivirgaceae bacterium]|nr:hypothetical protein [Salinivirgaceae bacterium]